ncbi:hypothetical protein ACMU_14860 [Actibacterium mucosum KCTC 23349]|uniref:Class I SAM-dependent methyltransferase n=1 Tax=Actibacterium mucosum KCTC 23349 TaxID=1454373 RepID=A0A037ZHD6_9RHOB|nr:class I SAM-dependent methyltransferase [Actibacterium mucosum]KAJ55034.1 hypothetical protein ACMU_14860 [Actibacterium mucosum KCTC 23349]
MFLKKKSKIRPGDVPEPEFPVLEGMPYEEYLALCHDRLKPRTYLEIGTESGKSLVPARGHCIAIDPEFKISHDVAANKSSLFLFQGPSDDFFASNYMDRNAFKIDFAFLDGMHLFEFLLRDLINTERHVSGTDATVMMHDCLPFSRQIALRTWDTDINLSWTGDVWKLIPIIARYRPDIEMKVLDCPPTALVQLRGLDPNSTVLSDNYDAIVGEFMNETLDSFGVEEFLNLFELSATS